jgi:hypothetical protein
VGSLFDICSQDCQVHESRSDPDSKQKTETKLAFALFFWISFIPNLFLKKRNTNRFVPVKFECVTTRDICDQNVTKSVLLKKLNKT